MAMKALVVINESHTLKVEQVRLLDLKFPGWERLNVPAQGWTLNKMTDELLRISRNAAIVFASPIPAMLKLAMVMKRDAAIAEVLVFHNDNRNKRELPNGKIIFTVAENGWQLV